ncbi:unnamed protein product, partial [Mesorhabditis belari]|uniref:Thioesterase domain-containing protein n=1 Tax=Mesorhabditis belari TaxID=2138241 RepID=A0AAF3E8Y9_9BILA
MTQLPETKQHKENVSNDDELLEFALKEFDSFGKAANFTRILAGFLPVSAKRDVLTCEFTVTTPHLNGKEKLHGGQSLTIIDVVTSRAISLTQRNRAKASLELSASYLLPISSGDEIIVIARVLHIDSKTAYSECELRRKNDGALCVLGKHTMAFL